MRLLLVGAFAFPHEQGSQVYFREQALALREAGAEVHLLTYGPGRRPATDLPGLAQTTLPAWSVPRSRRSGPSLGKPLADAALIRALRRLVVGAGRRASSSSAATASSTASSIAPSAASRPADHASQRASSAASSASAPAGPGGFDAILAHHVEAALVAIHGLPRSRPPILYCAHTLLEQELPLYFQRDGGDGRRGDPGGGRAASRGAIARLGGGLDRWIARRADGWIALTQASERVIRASSRGPGRRIAPPVRDPAALGERRDDARRLHELGLSPRGFFLYSGNLDPYQDLPLLEQVARRRAGAPGRSLPLVVASHAAVDAAVPVATNGASTGAPPDASFHPESRPAPAGPGFDDPLARRLEQAGVRLLAIRSVADARALFAGARATIVPRRSLGGFPIKLVNSLAAGTPVVAFHGDEWGLVDGHEALIADPADPVTSLAAALDRLELDPLLADRLGRGARARYAAEHRPALVAAETLDLIRTIVAGGRR